MKTNRRFYVISRNF